MERKTEPAESTRPAHTSRAPPPQGNSASLLGPPRPRTCSSSPPTITRCALWPEQLRCASTHLARSAEKK